MADAIGEVVDEVGATGEVLTPGGVSGEGCGDRGQPRQGAASSAAEGSVVETPVQHRGQVPRVRQPASLPTGLPAGRGGLLEGLDRVSPSGGKKQQVRPQRGPRRRLRQQSGVRPGQPGDHLVR
ncbi:hypothetical protein, partial [Aquipuribacter sp. MA13-13]